MQAIDMKGEPRLITVTPDGLETVQKLDRTPTLAELQCAVGGYIEVVPKLQTWHGEPCCVICNEEGKLKLLPVNIKVTRAWHDVLDEIGLSAFRPYTDMLVGTVAIIVGPQSFIDCWRTGEPWDRDKFDC